MEAIPIRLEAIAFLLEDIALRLEAIALRLEAIAFSLEAIARLEARAFVLAYGSCGTGCLGRGRNVTFLQRTNPLDRNRAPRSGHLERPESGVFNGVFGAWWTSMLFKKQRIQHCLFREGMHVCKVLFLLA